MTVEQLMEQFERRWNEGDLDRYLEIFAEDVVVYSDDTWPESDAVRGREGIARFWRDFRGVWDDVQVRVKTLHTGQAVAAAEAEWVTRGRASGVEGTIEFAFATWVEDGMVKRGQFFEELDGALEATGLRP